MTSRDSEAAHGSHGPLSERLEKLLGQDIDPGISLEPPDERPPSSHSADLVQRLQAHGPKETRYEMRGEIARGGMGAILKVWDGDLRRTLAMKVILGKKSGASPETAAVEDQQVARFLEEAQVTGQLDHPGIVPVHELGLDATGRVYFTMRLVRGRDLKQIFDLVHAGAEGWTQTKALGVMLKVCEAMAYAHTKGVIHRDLKPANVMVGRFGETYVMDWGLAKVIGRTDSHDIRLKRDSESLLSSVKTDRKSNSDDADSPLMTMDGTVVGTPAYMPPEQANGLVDDVDVKSDVYAVGAMLYHLLVGRMPYVPKGMKVSSHTVWRWVIEGPPKPVHALNPAIPAELAAICEKAMSRDPAKRYADTMQMAEDLQAFIDGRVVTAYKTGAVVELKKWVQRNKALASASAAAILLAVGGLSWNAYNQSRARTEIEGKNNELVRTNTALDEAKNTAQEKEKEATQKANDVLSLSAIQEWKELTARADLLWPALPDQIAKYERWLADAKVLVEGRPPDPTHGVEAHPGLKDHEAKLAELNRRARPLSSDQVEADRRSDPRYPALVRARLKATWLRRMLGEEPWPREADVEAEIARETLPADARALKLLALPLADPDVETPAYGSETRGLVIARRALALSPATERADKHETLVWALVRCGRFDEAIVESKPLAAEYGEEHKQDYESFASRFERVLPTLRGPDARAKLLAEESKLSSETQALEAQVSTRRTFEFDEPSDRWWHTQLAQLIVDLKAFSDPKTGVCSAGTSEDHGWGVMKRIEFARTIQARSVTGPDAARRWEEAIASIAKSDVYGHLALTPQVGLLPLGVDPSSHLWEFAHLQTGEPAERGTNGQWVIKPETGIVLVLLPAANAWMGAQRENRNDRNYDALANDDEVPVNMVKLDAFFLAKYEMTQAQWERIAGRNPSFYGPANYSKGWNRTKRGWSATHPVEHVSWTECNALAHQLGLCLPTEARWEYGCRAGTSTSWWSGDDKQDLVKAGNVADAFARAHDGGGWPVQHEAWDDGQTVHAEVGSYAPNAFGLHDTHGNVREWCSDGGSYTLPVRSGDGEREAIGAFRPAFRGGSYIDAALSARSAVRAQSDTEYRDDGLGLRPAMNVAP